MLAERILAAFLLAAIGAPAVWLGGYVYFAVIAAFVGLAAWEYSRMFQGMAFRPAMPLIVGGTWLLLGVRAYFPAYAIPALTALVLMAMTWHLCAYERGCPSAGTDFAITLGGFVYFGWIGAYLIELRFLPDGLWWFLLILPTVWISDSAAYFVGRAWGKQPLAPRLSPRKTWEGYWAGVLAGTLSGAGLAWLLGYIASLSISWWQGGATGLMLSILVTLGDLGESMFKRQAGLKDSSNLIPGHGGFFDRIDGWLWAAAIGYYLVVCFLLR